MFGEIPIHKVQVPNKYQVPGFKFQINSKFQVSNSKSQINPKFQVSNKSQPSVACVNNSETQCFRLSLSVELVETW